MAGWQLLKSSCLLPSRNDRSHCHIARVCAHTASNTSAGGYIRTYSGKKENLSKVLRRFIVQILSSRN